MYVMDEAPLQQRILYFQYSMWVIWGFSGFFSPLPLQLSFLLGKPAYSFSLGAKEDKKKKKKRLTLLDSMRKSRDICRDSLLVMGEWVYHCGIYEWPQVCAREVERGREGEREGETDRQELYHFWVMSLRFRCAPFEEASLIHFGPWKPLSAGMWAGLGI